MADVHELLFPRNPVEAIAPIAERLILTESFARKVRTPEEQEAIDDMNEILRIAQLIGSYTGKANTAFIVPEETEEEGLKTIYRFDNDINFRGAMLGSWVLKAGKDDDPHPVRTVCLVFKEAELGITNRLEGLTLPNSKVHANHNVQIPIFSVTEIEQLKET